MNLLVGVMVFVPLVLVLGVSIFTTGLPAKDEFLVNHEIEASKTERANRARQQKLNARRKAIARGLADEYKHR